MSNTFVQENEFYKMALQHPVAGEPGRRYLSMRGITEETIKFWDIGYAPIGHKRYRKLQGRITFPVFDHTGKIATISGRKVFDSLSGPKYDMYPFAARKILFGLWQNKNNMREMNRAAITEGQIDVITSWQKGFKIASSSFGAHGSLDHLSLLSRYAKNINVLYDSDKAGYAGIQGIKELSTLGDLNIEFKNPFPHGQDLDSWIKNHSAEELFNLLDRNEVSILKEKLLKIGRGIK
ncbi:DNA primase [compost metagenome]